jgi:hypothetical protein
MARELAATCNPDSCGPSHSQLAIHCLGVNLIGSESGNDGMCVGRIQPWLQDNATQRVWEDKWQVNYRDVVILDSENRRFAIFNCTAYDLSITSNYDSLKSLLLAAAHRPAS